jgi:hypothetical protein
MKAPNPCAPCPFCDSAEIWLVEDADIKDQWFHECMDCGALGPVAEDPKTATIKWNDWLRHRHKRKALARKALTGTRNSASPDSTKEPEGPK